MAVGFPTKVNYATGDVLSATNMNDLSGTVNLLDGTQYSGGKNRVLNSAMQVAQRGTSIAVAAGTAAYTLDRWYNAAGVASAMTISRQLTNDTTNLPNIQYCARVQRNAGQTGTATLNFGQSFESINSIPLAGKTVTLSFYARAGATFSGVSSLLNARLFSGTGTDENRQGSGYTGDTSVINQSATLTTTWQRFSYSGTVAITATELAPVFIVTPSGTAGATDYYEITGVQLEASTVASAFSTNGGTYQAELAACQRYYQRVPLTDGNTPSTTFGVATNTTVADFPLPLKVSMRTDPTTLDTSGITVYQVVGGSSGSSGTWTINASNTEYVGARYTHGSVLWGAGSTLWMYGSTGYIGFGAEL